MSTAVAPRAANAALSGPVTMWSVLTIVPVLARSPDRRRSAGEKGGRRDNHHLSAGGVYKAVGDDEVTRHQGVGQGASQAGNGHCGRPR